MQPVAAMALAINQISQFLQTRIVTLGHGYSSLSIPQLVSEGKARRKAPSWPCHQIFTAMTGDGFRLLD
jgi:hypothetical protein